MNAQIAWDLVMSEDMPFVEGCYRIEGGPWQVVTAVKSNGRRRVGVRDGVQWDSGVTGMNIVLPKDAHLNAAIVLALMSHHLGVTDWREVSGPDSMALR